MGYEFVQNWRVASSIFVNGDINLAKRPNHLAPQDSFFIRVTCCGNIKQIGGYFSFLYINF